MIQYLKILYIFSLAFWFYSLLLLFRLFPYHQKALKKESYEKEILAKHLTHIEKRAWFFTAWPALIATVASGSFLVAKLTIYKEGWLHFVIVLMLAIFIHHSHAGKIRKDFIKGTQHRSNLQLRILQFITYILLALIISIPFYKNLYNELFGLSVLIGSTIILITLIFTIRKKLKKKSIPENITKTESPLLKN
jgi:protoporphyrinogen IX oxidase